MKKAVSFLTRDFTQLNLGFFLRIILLLCILYGFYDLFPDIGLPLSELFKKVLADSTAYKDAAKFGEAPYFAVLIYGIAAFVIIYVGAFSYFCFKASLKKYDPQFFTAICTSHGLSNVVGMVFDFSLLLLSGVLIFALTGEATDIGQLYGQLTQNITRIYEQYIPTLFELPYPLAFLLSILLIDLVMYGKHWLVHYSRLLWYVSHRVHHTAEIMHPFGTGPVYAFGFLLILPQFFLLLAVTKLFSYEILFWPTMIFYMVATMLEKFNHASVFYNFIYKHKFLRPITAFYGSGVYHYTHHSAVEGEEINNLSGICFMFWDRIFGTYVKPRAEKPPVGLTHQPTIILNPVTLYFSGWQTIFYELKHNSPKHWLKIIFGSVFYTPPVTKDFLILGYNKKITLENHEDYSGDAAAPLNPAFSSKSQLV